MSLIAKTLKSPIPVRVSKLRPTGRLTIGKVARAIQSPPKTEKGWTALRFRMFPGSSTVDKFPMYWFWIFRDVALAIGLLAWTLSWRGRLFRPRRWRAIRQKETFVACGAISWHDATLTRAGVR